MITVVFFLIIVSLFSVLTGALYVLLKNQQNNQTNISTASDRFSTPR